MMGSYLSTPESDRRKMLDAIGLPSIQALFSSLPSEVALKDGLVD